MLFRILLLLLLLSGINVTYGQGQKDLKDVSINDFTEEIQKLSDDSDEIQMIWWIPTEFWEASFVQDPTMNENDVKAIIDLLSNYTIVAVADGDVGYFGGVTYKTQKEISDSLSIVGDNNDEYYPISTEEIDPDTRNLLSSLQPVLENMLGDLGKNMFFFAFKSENPRGKRIADPLEKQLFTVKYLDRKYEWKLPVSALLKERKCPVSGRLLNGSWNYCPWHGNKLL